MPGLIVESLTYTFESIFEEVFHSVGATENNIEIDIPLWLVRENGLNRFIDYCKDKKVKHLLEEINSQAVKLIVFRP